MFMVCYSAHIIAQQRPSGTSPAMQCDEQFTSEHKHCGHKPSSFSTIQKFAKNGRISSLNSIRGYDVLRYDLALDWSDPLRGTSETDAHRGFTGKQIITIRLDSSLSHIILDAAQMRIDSAFLGNVRIGNVMSQQPEFLPTDEETISLPLPAPVRRGDTLVFTLYYTHTSSQNDEQNGTGFFLYSKGRFGAVRRSNGVIQDTAYLPERLAYTMSEPFGARRWMPCNDIPSDKALIRVAVRVPSEYTAISNGLLVRTDSDVTSKTFVWAHSSPIAPYLMAVTASVYASYTEWYKKIRNPNDSLPITHFFWRNDDTDLPWNNANYNARRLFSITVGTMGVYARLFGEYPFERYGHVVVQPFSAGGMEHQTISTINRSWLRGTQAGVAHELMHQWFGNLVTCASWEHIWLNEGMASYGEALWYESWGGKRWYSLAMDGFANAYWSANAEDRAASVYVTEPSSVDAIFNYATTYAKGAWIHHSLRRILGDSTYFHIMKLYATKFAFRTATTDDLQAMFIENAPTASISLRNFFQEWVYGRGIPTFSAAWRIAGINDNTQYRSVLVPSWQLPVRVEVALSQLQQGNGVPDVYHLPISVTFRRVNSNVNPPDTLRAVRTIYTNERRTSAIFDVPFVPDSVIIDEAADFLCEKRSLSMNCASTPIVLRVYPNPIKPQSPFTVDFSLHNDAQITIEIFDMLGSRVATSFQGYATSGMHCIRDAVNLAVGVYVVRIRGNGSSAVERFVVAP
jgi:aminopeptidase N